MLYLSGPDVQELFGTLPDTGEDKYFDVAVKKLTDYFAPKQNTDFEIYKFRQAIQSPEENLEAYHTRLRKLAATCNFENPNEEIKGQIIQEYTSSSLRRHTLKSDKLTLTDLLAKRKRAEVGSVQANTMDGKFEDLSTKLSDIDLASKPRQSLRPRTRTQAFHTCTSPWTTAQQHEML